MRKKVFLSAIIFCLLESCGFSQNKDFFTIYLVRHSEKDLSTDHGSDPPLTQCGQDRSERLSAFFKDVTIEDIYSTNYKRTQQTAKPTSDLKKMLVKEYDARKLEEFSKLLLRNRKDALVVGHSNTTGVLAGLLVNEDIGAFSEEIYNRIYQVVVFKNKRRLHVFHTSFSCID